MIFTETREGRRFVGEVPPGMPLVASLRQLADNYRIDCGWFDCSGQVRDALVRPLQPNGEFGEIDTIAGWSLLSSLKVAFSHKNGARDVAARVVLLHGDRTIGGLLEEAVSGSVELAGQTFDDITLRRHVDYDTGLWRWMDVAVNIVTAEADPVRSGRVAMEAMPSRLLEPEEMPQLHVGDALQHPALGYCVITQVHDQDRVAIQVASGKIAQLHLGVLTLTRGQIKQGRMTYEVQVRRRSL
ncbi:MAG: hypothetical protein FJ100_09535 [Deltaproteobacteria bacterium]|nr:hypothetical protein [Deltaproteobacteria bacterium]